MSSGSSEIFSRTQRKNKNHICLVRKQFLCGGVIGYPTVFLASIAVHKMLTIKVVFFFTQNLKDAEIKKF